MINTEINKTNFNFKNIVSIIDRSVDRKVKGTKSYEMV
jgi:hypothetical protein